MEFFFWFPNSGLGTLCTQNSILIHEINTAPKRSLGVRSGCDDARMEKTLEIINQMRNEGLFSKYAIGGGIAALFYIEPFATFDLDIFILLPESSGSVVSLSSIYSWLEKKGYKSVKEQITIEGVPVQFIPAYNDLVSDGVQDSIEKKYGKSTAFVLRPEYLVAIMIQTNRSKDRERLLRFMKESDIFLELLDKILIQHDLKTSFDRFRRRYLAGPPDKIFKYNEELTKKIFQRKTTFTENWPDCPLRKKSGYW